MSTRFEQLIEYVINDENEKARELFHDFVVEKSRAIYEEMMDEEDVNEAADHDDDEEVTEAAEDDDEEVTEAAEDDEEVTESMMDEMGTYEGDASDQLMSDVEMEEEGMSEDDMNDFADETGFDDAEGSEDTPGDLEDRVVDLEDKLDELMAEFEELMNQDEMDDMGDDEGMDDMDAMDDMGGEEEEEEFMEAISLKAAPKPKTSEEGGINTKSPYTVNSGAAGMEGKPVHTGGEGGGKHDTSAYSNKSKDLISDFQNKAGSSMKDQKPATKPHLAQATGVNTKSPLGKA